MPKPVKKKSRVYNLIDFNAYPLLESTILDNRVATHLVNSANCLVSRSFYSTNPFNIVEAGT